MTTITQNSRQLKKDRRVATKFNVLSFKNYDGTTTIKVISRDQYDRLNCKFKQ
jgi:hypothetical protein